MAESAEESSYRGSSSRLTPEDDDQCSPPRKVPRATLGSSPWPRSQSEPVPFPEPLKQLNDNVYEVCKPKGRPSVEILFFHGLQLKHSSFKDAQCHITTWLSRDKSNFWLKWLLQKFPRARILTILYDASARRTDYEGLMDMYLTSENLMQSITGSSKATIGQDGCPVVLVGHCLGGLVMKSLCVQANSRVSLNLLDKPGIRALDNFLQNVKGLFSYATPHHGFRLADSSTKFRKGELYENLKTFNKDIARLNEEFRMLREKNGWKTFGVGELHDQGNLTEIVIAEASTRHDVDGFYTIAANHYDVCRPVDRQCSSFQLLETFIAGVLKEVKPSQADLLAGLNIVGLEASVSSVEDKLCIEQRLAIVGIGGIGKTTLAKAVFDKIYGDFEYTCFLDKVKEKMKEKMTDEENPRELRDEIIKGLKRRGYDVSESFQWSTLQGKKVLIILDDVEFDSQVRVMTEADGFNKESRVVVTSRNKTIFRGPQKFYIHRVTALDLDDSKTLFCLHAFNQRHAHQGKEELVTRFAEKCAGLPLALKVSGKYLCNQKDDADWEAALENLRKAKPLDGSADSDGLWSILRVSYNSLADSEREMFLDVATYFVGAELKHAKEVWRVRSWGGRWAPNSMWQNLSDRSLVSEDRDGRIQMHDVLLDMGSSITDQSRVRFDDISELMQLSHPEKVKILSLGGHHVDSYHYVDADALSKMEMLEVLHFNTVLPDGPGSLFLRKLVVLIYEESWALPLDPDPGHSEEITAGLQKLFGVQSLRFIVLDHLSIQHLPIASGRAHLLSQLERLEIKWCWSLVALPNEFQQLQKLSHVAVTHCLSLKELPDSFAHLGTLERLEIERCDSLVTLPAGFGQLRRLQLLSITYCGSLKELPDSFVLLGALKRLEIRHCSNLEISLSCLHNLRALKHLDILKCKKLTGVDTEGGWYELSSNRSNPGDELHWVLSAEFEAVLQSLSFQDLDSMRAIGDHDEGLVRGVWVNSGGVSYCGNLANLPGSLGQPQRVQRLVVKGWTKGVMDLQNFEELQDLTIEDSHLEGIPRFLGQLGKLQRLRMKGWMHLQALPDTFGLPLQHLEIERCDSLVRALPDTLGNLRALNSLSIKHCKSLVELPNSLAQLSALESLEIQDCSNLEISLQCVHNLHVLQHLDISKCKKIIGKDLAPGPGWCELASNRSNSNDELQWVLSTEFKAAFHSLSCQDLDSMHTRATGDNEFLQHNLDIPGPTGSYMLSSNRSIPNGELQWVLSEFGALPRQLKMLHFLSFRSLDSTHDELHSMRATADRDDGLVAAVWVNSIGISYFRNLANLPRSMGQSQRVQCLTIRAWTKEVMDLQNFEELQDLTIEDSPLSKLPNFSRERKLRCLRIKECNSLELLSHTLGHLRLQCLEIEECYVLGQALPDTLGNLRGLQCLKIIRCISLITLPDSLGDLGKLQYLQIDSCISLKALPNTLGNCLALQHLKIEGCSLEALPHTLGDLCALQHLQIEGTTSLTALPNSLGNLGALQHLQIGGCHSLEALPYTLGDLRALQHLQIGECHSLEALPYTLGDLRALQHLQIEGTSLTALPNSLGNLQELRHLQINSASLKALPNTLGNLCKLQCLKIICCRFLTTLPDSLGDLGKLQYLQIDQCYSLKALPNTLGNLCELQHLQIEGTSLTALPNSLGNLQELRHLQINSASLKALPNTLGNLCELQRLEIGGNYLEVLPGTFGDLEALQRLEIRLPHSFGALPFTFGRLQNLVYLKIDGCYSSELQTLPDSLGGLSGLQSLNIVNCDSLLALPDTLGRLQNLVSLTIKGCSILKTLPNSLGCLSGLQSLNIVNCDSLLALPDTLGRLQNLVSLTIKSCSILKTLPNSLGCLSGLQSLNIVICDSLLALPDTLGRLQNLVSLTIENCSILKTLPDSLCDLSNLQSLKIRNCNSLEALPNNLELLQHLAKLCICHCPSFTTISESIGQLSGLQHLKIWGCRHLEALPNMSRLGCSI